MCHYRVVNRGSACEELFLLRMLKLLLYSDVGLDDELSSLSRATETVEYMSWRAVKDGQVVGRFPFVFTPFTCRENRSSRERCYPELQNQAHSIGYPRLLLFLSTLDLHQIVLKD